MKKKTQSDDYKVFLNAKQHLSGAFGFEPLWMPDVAFPFQRDLTAWAINKGRAAIFADCGLGKTLIQLIWAENVARKTGQRVLILTPLAVAQQTVNEAHKFGIVAARSKEGELEEQIVVTNYDRLHRFNPEDFAGVVCDESSILKHYTGATQKQVTRFMSKMRFRLLCTATAAPNDFVELGTSSEALGELTYSEMLKRFFRQLDDKGQKKELKQQEFAEKAQQYYQKLSFRVSQTIGQWRLKHHAREDFWRWVASWARACRKPSDIGHDDTGYDLPRLIENVHVVDSKTPRDGWLFTVPAFGGQEEREERKHTLNERCELAAKLANHKSPVVVWCQYNYESEKLAEIIPNSFEVRGSDSMEYKEAVAEWFKGDLCACTHPLLRPKLAEWKNSHTNKNTTEPIKPSGLSNQNNGAKNTAKNEKNTCGHTTLPTKKSGQVMNPSLNAADKKRGSDIELTQNTAEKPSNQQNQTEKSTQPGELTPRCENTERHSKPMRKPSHHKAGGAQFADHPDLKTQGNTACMLTTATKQDNTEECCAQDATLGLESLGTQQKASEKHTCICGHVSGNRKLITKSKIFGFGQNWQHCNHVITFASHSYEQYYQSVRRCWRFGQEKPVTVDVIASEGESRVLANMQRKAAQADEMFSKLVLHMGDALSIKTKNTNTNKPTKPSWL